MSIVIGIMGASGSGKTYSLRNLDPKTTFYFDADSKGLNWKGWRESFHKNNKNYYQTNNQNEITKIISSINTQQKHIKNIVIDTVNGVMIADEMRRMKEKGYDKWIDLAQSVYNIVHNANSFRDDLVIILVFHTQEEENGFTHILTNGKKLNKIQLESMLNNLLLCKCTDGKYIYETRANNSTAKTYVGLFEPTIENDIIPVIEKIKEF